MKIDRSLANETEKGQCVLSFFGEKHSRIHRSENKRTVRNGLYGFHANLPRLSMPLIVPATTLLPISCSLLFYCYSDASATRFALGASLLSGDADASSRKSPIHLLHLYRLRILSLHLFATPFTCASVHTLTI